MTMEHPPFEDIFPMKNGWIFYLDIFVFGGVSLFKEAYATCPNEKRRDIPRNPTDLTGFKGDLSGSSTTESTGSGGTCRGLG